jgi:D-3-phosphoglycerate dehydrogenase
MTDSSQDICLIIQPIHTAGITLLKDANVLPRLASANDMQTVANEIGGVDAVITRSAGLDKHAMQQAANLRVIGSHGVGVNAIDLDYASELGIPVVNTPHANVTSVAEMTVSLMLAVMKQLTRAEQATRRGDFEFKYTSNIRELTAKTVGIIGFGNIGQQVADILRQAFQMSVLVYSPSASAADLAQRGVSKVTSLQTLLATADVVSLHVPLTEQTYHLIGRTELACMKQHAVLINTSRGDVVDEHALVDALQAGTLAGAGLDVYHSENMPVDHPLLHVDNVVLTPHIAGSSQEALERTALTMCQQVIDVLAHKLPAHLVNSDVWARRRK